MVMITIINADGSEGASIIPPDRNNPFAYAYNELATRRIYANKTFEIDDGAHPPRCYDAAELKKLAQPALA